MSHRAIVLAHRLVLEGGSELSPAQVTLIRRTLEGLAQAGVSEICVVDGTHAEELAHRLALDEIPSEGPLRVEVRANRSWKQASGSAVLLARDYLEAGPCLVVRGDRPLDRAGLERLASTRLGDAGAIIAAAEPPVDAAVDMSGEVKVRLRRRRGARDEVAAIGLDLDGFDAVFTGHALVGPELLPLLFSLPNPALEDALGELMQRRRVLVRRGTWPWGFPRPVEVAGQVEAILDSKAHPRYTLLNPGPVNTTPRVKSALVHRDVCHRDASFSELLVSLTGKLRRIFRGSPRHTVCLLTGSGTAAMECALSSSVPSDRKVLVIDNGAFGERLLEIARVHEMDVVHLRYAWGDPVDPADVERAFEEHPDIAVVAMIHHETSVGLLNPVKQVGAISRRYDALFIVDAVSSLGAEDLDVVRDHIDICYASANKCLHAVSGAGFLCVAPRAWQKIESIKPRSYYLDLKRYRKYGEELAQTPFTPAVSTYFALDAACSEFLADGHEHRLEIYRARNRRMRRGLAELGMAPFTRSGRESSSVVTCCVPQGLSFEELYEGLRERGYIIYGCKEVLAGRFLQVANMGDLDEAQIDRFLAAARQVIEEVRQRRQTEPEVAAASA